MPFHRGCGGVVDGITWLDPEVIARYSDAVSSGHLALVEALALGKPLQDLGGLMGSLDPYHLGLSLPCCGMPAVAAGRHVLLQETLQRVLVMTDGFVRRLIPSVKSSSCTRVRMRESIESALIKASRRAQCRPCPCTLPSMSISRPPVKRWGGVVVSVAVALAIAFVPLPDLGSLLGAADSPAVDADAQRVYWEDLQPGMCSA